MKWGAKSLLLKYSSVNRFAECLAVGLDSFIGEACPKRQWKSKLTYIEKRVEFSQRL